MVKGLSEVEPVGLIEGFECEENVFALEVLAARKLPLHFGYVIVKYFMGVLQIVLVNEGCLFVNVDKLIEGEGSKEFEDELLYFEVGE